MAHWTDHASCTMYHGRLDGTPFDEAIPGHGPATDRVRREQLELAQKMCNACPVLDRCAAWVLNSAPDPCQGFVVAGMTTETRRIERSPEAAYRTETQRELWQAIYATWCFHVRSAHDNATSATAEEHNVSRAQVLRAVRRESALAELRGERVLQRQ